MFARRILKTEVLASLQAAGKTVKELEQKGEVVVGAGLKITFVHPCQFNLIDMCTSTDIPAEPAMETDYARSIRLAEEEEATRQSYARRRLING